MTAEPATERQVLYALVAGGFVVVVVVFVVGAALAGLVPTWWTASSAAVTTGVAALCVFQWRKTGLVLLASVSLFLAWVVGTLLIA